MGRVRITRPFVLLALAVLLAPRIEASRTGVSESNRPAAVTAARIDATSALASLAPVAAADVEITEVRRLNLGDVVLVESELEHENRFGLGSLELLGPTPLRGPPPSYPETRVRGFELLPPFRIGASPSLSLWPRQACGFSCREVVSDSRYDPWGLCLGVTDGPCSAVADSIKGAFEKAKTAVREELGSGAGSVALDAVVSTGLDVVDTFLVDPLRAGEATGTAIGNDAGALDMTLAVVQDVGRGAALAGGAGSAAKAASRGVRAATRLPGAAGAAARTVGSSAMSRALTANVGGSRGFSLFSEFKGHLGEGLAYAERFLRGEKIVGKQITMTAGGGRARWDLLTQNRFNGQLKAVEAKLGRTAELSRQQPVVASAIEATGRAVVRGRKGVASLRSIGIEGGSVRSGVPLQNLTFVEQRFSFVETLIENPILPGLILQGATHGLDE